MLFRELTAVCSEIDEKVTKALRRQNVELGCYTWWYI
jgi:hypothetical protein